MWCCIGCMLLVPLATRCLHSSTAGKLHMAPSAECWAYCTCSNPLQLLQWITAPRVHTATPTDCSLARTMEMSHNFSTNSRLVCSRSLRCRVAGLAGPASTMLLLRGRAAGASSCTARYPPAAATFSRNADTCSPACARRVMARRGFRHDADTARQTAHGLMRNEIACVRMQPPAPDVAFGSLHHVRSSNIEP